MARFIIGHTTHHSSKIWFRASRRWPFAFIDVLDSADRKTDGTKVVETLEEDFYTGVVEWTKGLSSDRDYRAKVAFGKREDTPEDERIRAAYTEGQFRTFPSPNSKSGFTFMLGSCNLHSLGIFEKPDRAWTQISKLAKRNQARFMIHGGDQIYADIPLPPAASLDHYRDKYLDAWDDCVPARKTLTELPHYMILDDHEITNNFDNDMKGNSDFQGLARIAMKVYWEFQHSHNPHSTDSNFHYYYDFNYAGVKFFAFDTRYYRSSKQKQMLEPQQEEAFLDWLTANPNDLKFVISSVPFVTETKNPDKDKWCDPIYDEQRGRILDHILQGGITRLVFLTGDMHASCHSTLDVTDGSGKSCRIHELMSSPINQITPDLPIDKMFVPNFRRNLGNGLAVHSRIDTGSFYGNHSNIMAVEVDAAGMIRYRIYRTSKDETKPARNRSFTP